MPSGIYKHYRRKKHNFKLWDINNGVTLCVECHKLTKGRPSENTV